MSLRTPLTSLNPMLCVFPSQSLALTFPDGSDGKKSACNPTWDLGLIPGSGRSPGEGHGYPLQYSCLENPMGRGAWRATVHGVAESRTRPMWLTLSLFFSLSKRAHEIVIWREKSTFTKKQFLNMIFQSSYSWEYFFEKNMNTAHLLGLCLWSEKWPRPCWASISCLCSSQCQGPLWRCWVHSGLWMLGKEPVPFRLSLSAKCIVLYPTFLAELMLLAWCVELVLCALHAGRTWGVAWEGGEEKREEDAGRKEVEGMVRSCRRG